MAKIFTTGTINDANAAAVGLAMANRIRDDVAAHLAWELVEEFTPGSGTVQWTVLRCLATESGLPANYYVIMGRTLATGELRFAITEDYNSSTDTLQYFGPVDSAAAPGFDAQGRNTATYVLGTGPFTNANNTPAYANWIPSGTSTNWWLIVTEDGFTVAMNGTVNAFVHIGPYEPLGAQEGAIAMPLQMISSSGTGVIIRNPAIAGVTPSSLAAVSSAHQINGGQGGNAPAPSVSTPVLGFEGAWNKNDKLQNNQRVMAEIGIVVGPGTGAADTIGFALGKQKRMRSSSNTLPTGMAFGDTWAMDGMLWVPYKPNDGRLFDTGVPV